MFDLVANGTIVVRDVRNLVVDCQAALDVTARGCIRTY